MNKLLLRQLREHFGGVDKVPGDLTDLLKIISGTYDRYEKDREMVEHSIDLSSKEMIELNTELKKEKEELKKAHKELQTFFEDINEIVFTIDMVANRLIQTSAACEKIYGYTPPEFMADNDLWRKVIYPEDKHIIEQLIQILSNGKPILNEYRIVHKDGSIRWIENKIIPTLGADGRLVRINGVTSDITDRKQAEDKLTITTNELQKALGEITKIMDSSLDVICAVDAKGNFIKVSAASKAVWGYKPEELIGKPLINFVYHEDNDKTQATAGKVMAGNNIGHFENRYVRKDGSLVPIEWSARWDENDKIRYGVARDVTEKKRLEKAFEIERQRFYDLFIQAPSCIGILKGPDHVYEMANPLYLQLINKHDVVGKSVKDVLPEIAEQGFIELLDGVYNTGVAFSANEMLIKLDAGGNGELADKYLNFVYQAYRNNEGCIEGIFFFAIDVTEQVLSRKKIEESELRYRSLIEQATEAICISDPTMKFFDMNPSGCKMLGYSKEEFSLLSVADLIFPEDLKANPFKIDELKSGKTISNERRFKRKDGTILEVEINGKFLEDGRFIVSGRDISERKHAEKLIKESELRYRSLIEQATDAICIADSSMKFIDVNRYACEFLGYSKEEALQLSVIDILFIEDLVSNPFKFDDVQLNEIIRNERRFKRKDGSSVVMEVSTRLTEEGRFIMFGHDISERKRVESVLKESKDQLTIATQIAKLGYWEFDVTKNLFKFNDQFYSIFKTTVEEVGGYTMSSEQYSGLFVHPDDIPMVTKETTEAIKSPDPHYNRQIEHRIKYPNGEMGYMVFRFFIAKNEQGRTTKVFGAIQDITERKKTEVTLLKSEANLEIKNKQLEQKNKELEQFAYVASHDMQEPLRTTSSFVELLQKQYKGKLDEKADKYLTFISQSSDRMKVLIKDLLDYSRIGRKKELVKVDCNILLKEVLADLGKAINDANAEIKADDLPVINGYPTEIKQLFQNLVINAIKFRKQNTTPAINICVQKKGSYWEFTVTDNGIGIDEQHKERIFIIFQRLHTRNEYEGSGIGLAHCKKIVELHGGQIWIESKPGEGSTFHFTIPENNN